MLMPTTPAYDELARTYLRLHRLGHLQALAGWDQAANMPPKGSAARAAALAEMAALLHRMRTDPALAQALERAEVEALDDVQRANLREIRRDWRLANALPESLVQRRQLAASRCEHAWRTQRPANDWAGFLDNFREVLALAREEAERLSQQLGIARYDALMERFEPGMRGATVDQVFGDVRRWLPGLIARVGERQAREPVIQPVGPFPVEAQRRLCERVIRLLGFDFDAGRLDVRPATAATSRTCRATGSASRWPRRARWRCTRASRFPSRCSSAGTRASSPGSRRCWPRPSACSPRSSRRTCTG